MTATTPAVPAGPSPGPVPLGPFDERRKLIQSSGVDEVRREYALALCTFDEWTDPTELASPRKKNPELAKKIGTFTQMLVQRVLARAAFALQGREFEPSPETAKFKKLAKEIEDTFRTELVKAFPPGPGKTRFPYVTFARAFAAFVGGEIRTGKLVPIGDRHALANHGVPDGANYFCFAEAILVFLRLGLHPDFWERTLQTFVGGAQFFAARNWDRSARQWDAYKVQKKQILVPAQVVLAAIDHLYAGMSVPHLARAFSEIVGQSLRDDPRLVRPVPTPKEFQ